MEFAAGRPIITHYQAEYKIIIITKTKKATTYNKNRTGFTIDMRFQCNCNSKNNKNWMNCIRMMLHCVRNLFVCVQQLKKKSDSHNDSDSRRVFGFFFLFSTWSFVFTKAVITNSQLFDQWYAATTAEFSTATYLLIHFIGPLAGPTSKQIALQLKFKVRSTTVVDNARRLTQRLMSGQFFHS